MNNTSEVNHLLDQLGVRIGTDNLRLSDQGTCSFLFDDAIQVVVELPQNSQRLYLYAVLLPVPEQGREMLYARLLRLNLFCYETNGATFAIHDQHNAIVLCYYHLLESLDYVLFETILENFLMTAARWHRELQQPADQPSNRQTSAGVPSDPLAHFNKLV